MDQIDSIRAMLYSKNIDASNVKPYTGLHLNATGNGRNNFTLFTRVNFWVLLDCVHWLRPGYFQGNRMSSLLIWRRSDSIDPLSRVLSSEQWPTLSLRRTDGRTATIGCGQTNSLLRFIGEPSVSSITNETTRSALCHAHSSRTV